MATSSTRVVVAMSGGVDSSVAAFLLKKQGYDVLAIFMKNWHDESVTISAECPWLEDSYDAMLVAEKLKIPFQVIDLSNEYKDKIVDYMFNEYEEGRTPNPDILCNREIKFDIFLNTALKLNADFIATGHYAQVESKELDGNKVYYLISGKDKDKDQSYFLCQLNQFQLSKTLFPIGSLKKDEVRSIAKDNGLITADKKDSQGLCFIGKVKLPDFLQQKLSKKRGNVILIPRDLNLYSKFNNQEYENDDSNGYLYQPDMGKVIGEHSGAHYFTIGQRKGLSIGGMKDPLFVLATDTNKNIIYVGEGENHPGLYRISLRVKKTKMHYVVGKLDLSNSQTLSARIRYRQPLQKVNVKFMDKYYLISFDKKQKSIAKGQFVAIYNGDNLISSGIID
ncbi:MAG: tRNA 2-thiouridine(34) synthase MnmA [Flavobacteriaceae bacterium]|nr:tRNA 2-thiouridine(34) synthase MnmA [Flavobacteriaceae bacterium]